MNTNCCKCPKPDKPASERSAIELALGASTLSDDLDTPISRKDVLSQAVPASKKPGLTPKDAAYYSTYYPAMYD